MKKLTLTLISAAVLAACSSGGSGSNHHSTQPQVNTAPNAQIPKAEDPKVEMPKVEQPKAEEPKVEMPKVERPKVEEPRVEMPKAERPKTEEPKVEMPKAEQPKVEEPRVEMPKAEQPKAEEPKVEMPKVEQPKVEEPKVEMPKNEAPKVEQPKAELPKQVVTDQDIFAKFSNYGSVHEHPDLITLKLEGREIKLAPQKDINLNNHNIKTLRDEKGNLLGYYGFAMTSRELPHPYNPMEKITEYNYLPLLEMNEEAKTSNLPNHNLTYRGKMHYHLVSVPVQSFEADVVADYDGAKKRISVSISDYKNNWMWELKDEKHQRSVPVEEDASIAGKLYLEKQPHATFTGNLYGEKADVLVGKTESIDLAPQNHWKGVVGATISNEK